MSFILRSVFWLGLALLIIQPRGMDLSGSAQQLGATAMETGRTVALDGIGQIACDSIECTGAKFVAQSALKPPAPVADAAAAAVSDAPYPAPPLRRVSL